MCEFLHRIDEAVDIRLLDREAQRYHATSGEIKAGLQHIDKEQFSQTILPGVSAYGAAYHGGVPALNLVTETTRDSVGSVLREASANLSTVPE
ncbi:hypothetical protein MesoLj113a_73150 [Mesorhizobium sp. 113-1-2]|nr:hypothetical protein MesoLj113a_73150 [Mesorhizobium sp. 113-1-2]